MTSLCTVGLVTTWDFADVLYDNGPVNDVDGYSNATSGVFGFRRTLLDDFIVPAGGWTLQELHWNSVWQAGGMGMPFGHGADISLRSDVSGTPGAEIAVANVTAISGLYTGNIYFSREEVTHWATFSDIALPAGHYWFEAAIQGPQNSFWLTAAQNFNECWVNYEDLGGFMPGSEFFGNASDINFVLGGVPVPPSFFLFGAASIGCLGRRRRSDLFFPHSRRAS